MAHHDHNVPVLPIHGCLYSSRRPHTSLGTGCGHEERHLVQEWDNSINGEDEDEVASWLLLNPMKNISSSNNNNNNSTNKNNGVDEYLDLTEYNSPSPENNQFSDPYIQYGVPPEGDNIVPVQYGESKETSLKRNQQHIFQLGLDYEPPKAANSYRPSLCRNVCVSSMDVGIVPESAAGDISFPYLRPPKGTMSRFYGPSVPMPRQLNPIEREARVLRYREKKKTRKFQKTIRYATRKAYAETRPRIRGRFAKRTDVEMEEANQMVSTKIMMGTGYGIVPSFYSPTCKW